MDYWKLVDNLFESILFKKTNPKVLLRPKI